MTAAPIINTLRAYAYGETAKRNADIAIYTAEHPDFGPEYDEDRAEIAAGHDACQYRIVPAGTLARAAGHIERALADLAAQARS